MDVFGKKFETKGSFGMVEANRHRWKAVSLHCEMPVLRIEVQLRERAEMGTPIKRGNGVYSVVYHSRLGDWQVSLRESTVYFQTCTIPGRGRETHHQGLNQ